MGILGSALGGLAAGGPVGAIAGVSTSLLGGWLQSRAAKKAAEQQAKIANGEADKVYQQGQDSANALRRAGEGAAIGYENAGNTAVAQVGEAGRIGQEAIQGAVNRFNPYAQAGTDALARLQSGIAPGGEFSSQFSFDPSTSVNEAGLKYQQKQAQSALINSGLAGGLIGGNTARALDEQTQGITATYLRDAYDRSKGTFQMNRDNAINPLTGLINTGLSATNSQLAGTQAGAQLGATTADRQGSYGLQTAQGAGNFRLGSTQSAEQMQSDAVRGAADLRTGGAAASAAGTVGSGNAWADALSGVNKSLDFGSITRKKKPFVNPVLTVPQLAVQG